MSNISELLPKKMIEVMKKNAPLHQKTLLKEHFSGHKIRVRGIIDNSDSIGSEYTSFYIHDKDGALIALNFSLPVDHVISSLGVGDDVAVEGTIFNISDSMVVLDDCKLLDNESLVEQNEKVSSEVGLKWWERTSIQVIMILGAIAGIVTLLLYFL